MSPEELCDFRLECLKLAVAGREHDMRLAYDRAPTALETVARADAYAAFVMGEHEKQPAPPVRLASKNSAA